MWNSTHILDSIASCKVIGTVPDDILQVVLWHLSRHSHVVIYPVGLLELMMVIRRHLICRVLAHVLLEHLTCDHVRQVVQVDIVLTAAVCHLCHLQGLCVGLLHSWLVKTMHCRPNYVMRQILQLRACLIHLTSRSIVTGSRMESICGISTDMSHRPCVLGLLIIDHASLGELIRDWYRRVKHLDLLYLGCTR